MKSIALIICLLGFSSFAAPSDSLSSAAVAPPDAPMPAPSGPPSQAEPWSVIGKWHGTHPAWTDDVVIDGNGTFTRANEADGGRWILSTEKGRVVLTLAWYNWPAETVEMTGQDEFRGKVANGELTLQRAMQVSMSPSAAGIEMETWRQGEPPVRLIRKDEGFCALSLVTGHFEGGGEAVRVYIGDDGYWYLGGNSMQQGVAAECIVVRYPVKS